MPQLQNLTKYLVGDQVLALAQGSTHYRHEAGAGEHGCALRDSTPAQRVAACCAWLLLFGFFLSVPNPGHAQSVGTESDDSVLEQMIIFGRHGVRSPVLQAANLAQGATRPYPNFGVPAGYLTEHGAEATSLLGRYFRAYLMHEGLLSGNSAKDAGKIYVRANSIQRSNATAAAFAAALIPGTAVPVHSYPLGKADPVFDPIGAKIAAVDRLRAESEVKGTFGSGAAVYSAYRAEFELVRRLLLNGKDKDGVEITDVTASPIPLTASAGVLATGGVIDTGSLFATFMAADPFIMEFANGLPLEQVGWGELSRDALSQQTRLITLHIDIELRTPYLDRIQSSNAASHVLRSMQQIVTRKRVAGAFGDTASRLIVVNSSDGYVVGLAGLLHAHWLLPGYQRDYCPPGGALVFELRRRKASGRRFVRVFFTAQTLEQLRDLTELTLDQPPATAQLFIADAGRAQGGLDMDFDRFRNAFNSSIDSAYVQKPNLESPPGPLVDVPLK